MEEEVMKVFILYYNQDIIIFIQTIKSFIWKLCLITSQTKN